MPEDWRKDNEAPIFKKGRKEDSRSYRSLSLASAPEKMKEYLVLDDQLEGSHSEKDLGVLVNNEMTKC